jgi:hypothetical protein
MGEAPPQTLGDPDAMVNPADPAAPGYWMDETGGELAGAIKRYLHEEPLSIRDVQLIGAYFRQWINSPVWDANPSIDYEGRLALASMRQAARSLHNRAEIAEWLERAGEAGMDPL